MGVDEHGVRDSVEEFASNGGRHRGVVETIAHRSLAAETRSGRPG